MGFSSPPGTEKTREDKRVTNGRPSTLEAVVLFGIASPFIAVDAVRSAAESVRNAARDTAVRVKDLLIRED